MKPITKELKEKKEKSQIDKLILLSDDSSRQRIVEIRNEGTGRTWSEVAEIFNKEMSADFTSGILKDTYEQELSLTVEISGNKEKLFSSNIKAVQERYDRVNKTLDKYQKIVDSIIDSAADLEGNELFEFVDDVFRAGKQIEIIYKMVNKNIDLLLSEQEKISVKQEKNKVVGYSDQEVAMKFKKYLPEILRDLDILGRIKVIDESILKKI